MTTFSISLNVAAIDGLADGLVADAQAAARPAAQAMAQVLYDEVRQNVSRLKRHTGNLAASIYQVYSKSNSDDTRATYHISWNARKAPHGHLVEFGHLQRYLVTYDPATRGFITHRDKPLATPKHVAAKPFVRPALAKREIALQAGQAEFTRRMLNPGEAGRGS